ncbi:MAG: metallophosphoesterase, partial [Lamprocystis purpurea]|nr:metallophosphoesterase [Lamprocystis purpurea]
MSTDSFSWLHLTDLHYGLKGQDCLWPNLRQPFLEHLGALHDRCGPWDAVFFTGDLVQSGESAQFERMEADVLGPLWERLADLGSRDAVLLAVPGNHDLHRPDPDDDDAAVDTLLRHDGFQGIAGKFWDKPNCCYRRVIQDAFAAYSQWWEHNSRRPAGVTAGTLPGDFAVTIDRGDLRIGIVGLNTAFLQLQPGNYKGCLVWDPKQLGALFPAGIDLWTDQHDLCLLLTHQGTDWLTDEAQGQSVEIAPPGRFAAHLFGHMHEAAFQSIRRGGGGHDAVLLCQGCSVFGMERRGDPPQIERAHGYAAGRILCGEPQPLLRLWPSIATNKLGGWRFIPDHDHGVLESDDGTAPEPLSTRSRKDKSIPVPPPTPARLVPIPAGPHSTLPAPQPFFGRRDCLAKIAQYLTPENRGWGVVLDGPGGVGKTALALEAAHRAPAEHFPLKLWITAKNRELRPEGEFRIERHRVGDLNAMLAELGRALARDDIPRAS